MKHLSHINLRTLYKSAPLLILAIITLFVTKTGSHRYISLDMLRNNQIFLQHYIIENAFLSVIIYSLVYFVIVSLAIPVATIMTIVGGFLFGQVISTVCIIFAASFGACIMFLSAKLATNNLSEKKNGRWFDQMQEGFSKNALFYMITLRLLPIVPSVIINIIAGTLQISLKNFFFGTLIGIIPATIIFASVGVSMRTLLNAPNFSFDSLLEPHIIISLTWLGIMALVPMIYRFRLLKKKKN